ncbi:hypothetical protein VI03_09690 [Burkholderia vietnamiensis]|uniref:Uncharacterized protein n=1 Tax=Burkholderia vietnamiensis TaxID=60552 RepID=A0AAW7TC97_BURVI|nr:hypothetical protein [Burkholderia vietnamiensis]KKI39125.1 hypothetical protein VI03_09690 [Burkholderia vietnamiensis]MDN7799813.1 hypothetical protein [Burkholderia vietnamiensis]MDN8036265.1 hypothetical protein [Burkholderia vietnamiensis]HDR9187632.1 hypothetical protein [Burkholderia vietnamiensis]
MLFPKAMDANEYARKVQPADKSLGLLLQQAEWLGKGPRPGVTTAVTETPQPAARKEAPPVERAAPLLPTPAVAPTPEQPEPVPLLAAVPAPATTPTPELPPIPAAPATAMPEPELETAEGVAGELLLTFGERQ